ncbi:MAG: NADH-quinone oxidoreductase subunit N [Candidatus Dasytiphilus stammeri]
MNIEIKMILSLLPMFIIGAMIILVLISMVISRRNSGCSLILTLTGLLLSISVLIYCRYTETFVIIPFLSIDGYYIFFSLLILISSFATVIFSNIWLSFYPDKEEFYLLLLIASLGGILLASANNFASLFIGIELMSVPLLGIIGYASHNKFSIEACIKYSMLSFISTSFFLFSLALIYGHFGNLVFSEIGTEVTAEYLNKYPLLLVGLALLITSIGFKLSLVPFHFWTPDVYQGVPTPVITFLATTIKIAIFSAIARFLILVSITDHESIRMVLEVMAFLSIVVGNLLAFYQKNLKRFLGYSSIAHLGYLWISLIFINKHLFSLETAEIYLLGYLLSSLGLLGIITLISSRNQTSSLDNYRGLFWKDPVISIMMTIMMLSLAGIPMTLGFIGKFYLIMLLIIMHAWWLMVAFMIGSVIAICYYLRITVYLYLSPPMEKISSNYTPLTIGRLSVNIAVLILTILVIILGLIPQVVITFIKYAHPIPS